MREWLISDIAGEKMVQTFRHISISPGVFSCAMINSVYSWEKKTQKTTMPAPAVAVLQGSLLDKSIDFVERSPAAHSSEANVGL